MLHWTCYSQVGKNVEEDAENGGEWSHSWQFELQWVYIISWRFREGLGHRIRYLDFWQKISFCLRKCKSACLKKLPKGRKLLFFFFSLSSFPFFFKIAQWEPRNKPFAEENKRFWQKVHLAKQGDSKWVENNRNSENREHTRNGK